MVKREIKRKVEFGKRKGHGKKLKTDDAEQAIKHLYNPSNGHFCPFLSDSFPAVKKKKKWNRALNTLYVIS